MSDAKILIKINGCEIQAEGPQEWVDGHLEKFYSQIKPVPFPSSSLGIRAKTEQEPAGQPHSGEPFALWCKQHAVTTEILEKAFHFSGTRCEITLSQMSGKSDKAKMSEVLLFFGVKFLFETGKPEFTEGSVRDILKKYNCFNSKNNSTYLKELSSHFVRTGEKLELTKPALKMAADRIKALSGVPDTLPQAAG